MGDPAPQAFILGPDPAIASPGLGLAADGTCQALIPSPVAQLLSQDWCPGRFSCACWEPSGVQAHCLVTLTD